MAAVKECLLTVADAVRDLSPTEPLTDAASRLKTDLSQTFKWCPGDADEATWDDCSEWMSQFLRYIREESAAVSLGLPTDDRVWCLQAAALYELLRINARTGE